MQVQHTNTYQLDGLDSHGKVVIFFHEKCVDGIGAAFLAAMSECYEDGGTQTTSVRDRVIFIPYNYDNNDHLNDTYVRLMMGSESTVFVDIVPSVNLISAYNDVAQPMRAFHHQVIVMDHHETGIKKVEAYISERNYQGKVVMLDEHTSLTKAGNFDFLFNVDNTQSGTGIVQTHYASAVLQSQTNAFFSRVSDRDTWQFKLQGSRALHAYLVKEGYLAQVSSNDEMHDLFVRFKMMFFLDESMLLTLLGSMQLALDTIDEQIRNTIDSFGVRLTLTCPGNNIEHRLPLLVLRMVPMIKINESRTGELLYTEYDADLAITYQDDWPAGVRRFSVRTPKEKTHWSGFTARNLAEAMGGGGHPDAAGFTLPLGGDPREQFDLICDAIRQKLGEKKDLLEQIS